MRTYTKFGAILIVNVLLSRFIINTNEV